MYLSMNLHKELKLNAPLDLNLPKGCLGVMFVFKTKSAARNWEGKKVELCEVSLRDENHTNSP